MDGGPFLTGVPSGPGANTAFEAIRAIIGDRLFVTGAGCDNYGHDGTGYAAHPAEAICYPLTTQEVSLIVQVCASYGVPVVPSGGGQTLGGQASTINGCLCIDVSRMTRIVAVHPEDRDATVEPGVTRRQLNAHLRATGLFFPLDPGGESTLGGMAATRACGTDAVRYGTMCENVLAMTVVLADGSVIRAGSRARKASAGYDLTRLFVGSEGTLGIITELTIRLYGVPEAISSAICPFASIDAAIATIVAIIQSGIPVARLELLDPRIIQATNGYCARELAATPTLFMEFHGSPGAVAGQMALARNLAEQNDALAFEGATDVETRNRLWHARHTVHYAIQAMRPDARVWSTDVCVPISNLVRCAAETHADIAGAPFFISIVGHVGDGNFHLGLVVYPANAADLAEAESLNDRLVRRVIALDGACPGERGLRAGNPKVRAPGYGRGLGVMQAIKTALDPLGILNPGNKWC